MKSRRHNPTWEELEAEFDALPKNELDGFYNWYANWRPDFEFAAALAKHHSCTVAEAREHGAPQAVFDTIGVVEGFIDPSFDQPDVLGWGGVIVNHPTLGWFVVTPSPNPNTDIPILYSPPGVRHEVFAYAVIRVLFPCCTAMKRQLDYDCEKHGSDCPDRVVRFSKSPEPEGRWLLVAQNAEWDFEFCPWCGTRFQEKIGESGARRLWVP